jgi:hypothetical protein
MPVMAWLSYRVRAELRSRWRSFLALILFVGLVGGVVLTATAGARRTATAADRLTDASRDPDSFLDANGTDESKWDRIDDLPSVEAAAPVAFVYAFMEEGYYPIIAATDDQAGNVVGRGVLVAGRRPRPGAADEVVLSEAAAKGLRRRVGQTLSLRTVTPEEAEAFDQNEDVTLDDMHGPRVTLRIVGLVRGLQDLAVGEGDPTVTVVSRAFFEKYQGKINMRTGNFLLRLKGGQANVERFNDELHDLFAGGPAPGADAGSGLVDVVTQATDVQAVGLGAFAAVFLLFGLGAVAQAMSRTVHAGAGDQAVLAGLGLTRRGRFLDGAAPAALAAVIGCVLAGAVAIVASPLLPVGLAGRAEPDPGLDVDAAVLVPAIGALLLLVLAVVAWPAWRLSRQRTVASGAATGSSRPSIADRLARTGRPSLAVGIGMATRRGRGPTEVAVRTALAGVLLGAAGLSAAVVFSGSLQRLLDTPSRYGWVWDVTASTDEYDKLVARKDTAAVAEGIFQQTAQVAGRSVYLNALDVKKGRFPAPVAAGRGPLAPDEAAVGAELRKLLGGADTVRIRTEEHAATFRIVGTALNASIDDPAPIGEGVWLTPKGLERLGLRDVELESSGYAMAVITFKPGVDVRRAADTIDVQSQNDRTIIYPHTPAEIAKLDQVRDLPRLLAIFLGGLAILAVGHALVQTVQRRRVELGVLRAIGFTRRQVAGTIGWQAAALALVGGIVGLPLGIAVGRWVWTSVADGLGVAPRPEVALPLLLVVPAAVAVAALVGAALGAIAARTPAAVALRAE